MLFNNSIKLDLGKATKSDSVLFLNILLSNVFSICKTASCNSLENSFLSIAVPTSLAIRSANLSKASLYEPKNSPSIVCTCALSPVSARFITTL